MDDYREHFIKEDMMTSIDPGRNCLSLAETVEAISAISDAGWIRLRRVANRRCYGQIDPDDLLHEAFLSAIEGHRKCPHDVDVIRFLAEAMRSLASSRIKSFTLKPELKLVPLANNENELPYDPPSNEPTPEEKIISYSEVARIKAAILALFTGDEIAQFIIEGDMDEIDPTELRDLTGLDKKTYASKRRLIRRRIEQAYPKGWKE